jgi:glucuronate isomerase
MNPSKYHSVVQVLQSALEKQKVIDIHTHLKWWKPGAEHLADLLTCYGIRVELISCGVPYDDIMGPKEPDDRVRAVAKHWHLIANTTTAWCFMEIARGLFGFEEKTLNEGNCEELLKLAAKALSKPDWWQKVLRDDCKCECAILSNEYGEDYKEHDSKYFAPSMCIDELINKFDAPQTLRRLSKKSGLGIRSLGDWKSACKEVFKWHANQKAVSISFTLPPNFVWKTSNVSLCAQSFSGIMDERPLGMESLVRLRAHLFEFYVEQAAMYNLPMNPMLGIQRSAFDNRDGDSFPRSLAGIEPKLIRGFHEIINAHPNAVFDFFVPLDSLSHEMNCTARVFSNVSVSGHWWFASYPQLIKKQLRERLEMLPLSKVNGFFSDAHHVEWIYGMCRLYKKQLASTLAEMVAEDYLEEEQAVEIAKTLLYENPKRMYLTNR